MHQALGLVALALALSYRMQQALGLALAMCCINLGLALPNLAAQEEIDIFFKSLISPVRSSNSLTLCV